MSKNKTSKPSDAEDYLNQLQWQSDNAYRRTPWYLIPKWKYKSVNDSEYKTSIFSKIIIFTMFAAIMGYLIYSSIVNHSSQAIAGLFFFLMAIIILLFAMRDSVTKSGNDIDENNSKG